MLYEYSIILSFVFSFTEAIFFCCQLKNNYNNYLKITINIRENYLNVL